MKALFAQIFATLGFTLDEIAQISALGASRRWKELVKLCFRKHYRAPHLNEITLPHSRFAQYTTLMKSLDNELLPKSTSETDWPMDSFDISYATAPHLSMNA